MDGQTALIVIDSGFSADSLSRAQKVLGVYDLPSGRKYAANSPFTGSEAADAFAGDALNHGSIVLTRLMELSPASPVVLIRAFGDDGLIGTSWHGFDSAHRGGQIKSPGWTEAYLWAVEHCNRLGLNSVANCSFGGYSHAMDGTGWNSFQLAKVTGSGKPGHIVVAAAGAGDGRAVHAVWHSLACQTVEVKAYQKDSASYNFWAGKLPDDDNCRTGRSVWLLIAYKDGQQVFAAHSDSVPPNLWNNRQQQTFTIEGPGLVTLKLVRFDDSVACGDQSCAQRFDCWVSGGGAAFLDHVDPDTVNEPAVFPQVISVGLRGGSYHRLQELPGYQPDVLLAGLGPISFRLPEVVAATAAILSQSSQPLDVDGVRKLLGKYPDSRSLATGIRS